MRRCPINKAHPGPDSDVPSPGLLTHGRMLSAGQGGGAAGGAARRAGGPAPRGAEAAGAPRRRGSPGREARRADSPHPAVRRAGRHRVALAGARLLMGRARSETPWTLIRNLMFASVRRQLAGRLAVYVYTHCALILLRSRCTWILCPGLLWGHCRRTTGVRVTV